MPTTAEPTSSPSEDPTTSEPTTATPTTAEPTEEPTTQEPTTAEPTTEEPTAAPTTPSPTVEATTTESGNYPTPRPTMKSARKWEMIHPQYKGSDGELLWHVYYGDFSDDDRFDGFRNNELWDADVIRPMLQMDEKFARYATMQKSSKRKNKQLARSSSTPVVHEVTEHSSSAVWLVFAGVALAAAFAYWYKYHSANSKLFNQVEATTLLSRRKEDECYVY